MIFIAFNAVQSPALCKSVNLFRGVCESNNRPHSEICLVVEQHCLLIDFPKSSTLAADNQVTKKAIDSIHTALKNLLNGTNSFVSTCLYNDFDDVATSGSAVNVSVGVIDGGTVYSAFYLTKLNIKFLKTTCFGIKVPELDCVVMHRDELGWVTIKKLNVCALLIDLVSGKLHRFRFPFAHVPASNLVDVSKTTQ